MLSLCICYLEVVVNEIFILQFYLIFKYNQPQSGYLCREKKSIMNFIVKCKFPVRLGKQEKKYYSSNFRWPCVQVIVIELILMQRNKH